MAWLFGEKPVPAQEPLQMKRQQSSLLTLEIVFCTPVAWLVVKDCTSTGLQMKRQQCDLITSETAFCDLLTIEIVFCTTVAWLFGKACTSTGTFTDAATSLFSEYGMAFYQHRNLLLML